MESQRKKSNEMKDHLHGSQVVTKAAQATQGLQASNSMTLSVNEVQNGQTGQLRESLELYMKLESQIISRRSISEVTESYNNCDD
jgi:hypothetical protein